MSYRPVAWKTAYTVDFTAQSNLNIKTGGNGTKSIDGKNWTWANDANANTADVTNGTGIVVTATNTNTNYNGGTRNCPILSIPVTSLFAGFDTLNHSLRLQVRLLLTNSITNFEYGGMGFEYTTTPTSQNFHMLKGFNSGANHIQTEDAINSITTIRTGSVITTDDILSVIYRGPVSYKTQSGTFSALPLNASTDRFAALQDATNLVIQTSSQLQVCLYMFTANTQGLTDGFGVTFTHLQLDYVEALPTPFGF